MLNDSPDNKELEKIVKSYNDKRVVYLENEKNVGISNSRNKLLETAKGEYLAIFDHDDISMPERLEKEVCYLDENKDVGVVSCNFMWMSNKKNSNFPTENIEIKKALPKFCALLHTGSMIRKSVLVENNIKYEQEYSPCEDFLLWTRLMNKTMFHNLPDVLIHYRDFDNTTQKTVTKMAEMTYRITNIMYGENPYLLVLNLQQKEVKKRNFLEMLLSFKNECTNGTKRKVITVCGIRIKIKNKKKQIVENEIEEFQEKYKYKVKQIKKKVSKGEKINVAFYVNMISMFPAQPLLDCLLKHKAYNPFIILAPDFRFGNELVAKMQDEAEQELLKKYNKNIINKIPIKPEEDNFDLDNIDIIVYPYLYNVSHEKFKIPYIIEKNILPFFVGYGYFRSTYDFKNIIARREYSYFWKTIAENRFNFEAIKTSSVLGGKNTLLMGYCKMDNYEKIKSGVVKNKQKTIMIAPHHSVSGGYNDILSLSNFERYSDLFLQLPKKYPDIHFIFRPHPALFILLRKEKFWGDEKVDAYLKKMTSYSNVTYSTKGDYFVEFAKSDGLISDCGSYLPEYFYTGKPQCYMLKSPIDIRYKFSTVGKMCLENCYLAYDEQAIIDFIENVIIAENDYKKDERQKFAKEVIMYNYPNVSSKICDYFNKTFGVKR